MASSTSNQLEEWGSHCSLSTCHALDFLPFKCQHCSNLYCSDHFKPSVRASEHTHQCLAYDESLIDARVPSCPLCGDPISIPPNTDPNIPMDSHLTNSCRLLDRSGLMRTREASPARPSASRACARARCPNKMLVPILCNVCNQSYCPSHRLGPDHACPGPLRASNHLHRASLAALKATMASTPALKRPSAHPAKEPQTAFANNAPPTLAQPCPPSLSVVDRLRVQKRHKAEEESRRKALEWRAQKGLLSEDEKLIYASFQADKQKKTSGEGLETTLSSKDCLIFSFHTHGHHTDNVPELDYLTSRSDDYFGGIISDSEAWNELILIVFFRFPSALLALSIATRLHNLSDARTSFWHSLLQ
ncbi:hypothetical protein CROQUDRAFT_666672 [Cronartium quercuum f. sp. fusiforme G11]|uniref:AN1-type domain-containing protein n=1 Tax=Cronartium quercuum f. sp. fusiforme G11 TaxID=708437 RepID=A0A9P6N8S2_9BASI|nr:hypothetical protein CROQUDRAFT_666672 [Cronartium quercuum f. sp. fusiforme G11]